MEAGFNGANAPLLRQNAYHVVTTLALVAAYPSDRFNSGDEICQFKTMSGLHYIQDVPSGD